jgi:hypothetical protein
MSEDANSAEFGENQPNIVGMIYFRIKTAHITPEMCQGFRDHGVCHGVCSDLEASMRNPPKKKIRRRTGRPDDLLATETGGEDHADA